MFATESGLAVTGNARDFGWFYRI